MINTSQLLTAIWDDCSDNKDENLLKMRVLMFWFKHVDTSFKI